MNPRIRSTLQQLEDVEWFHAVGIVDTSNALVLQTWGDAVDHCRSSDWEDLCLEAANRFRERLARSSVERFCTWNDVIADIKPTVVEFVTEKTRSVVRANQLPRVFSATVEWDILHLCAEAEFADLVKRDSTRPRATGT